MRLIKTVAFALALLLLLTGCDPTMGNSPSTGERIYVSGTEVENIHVTNASGADIIVQDNKSISNIVRYINSFTLSTVSAVPDSSPYKLTLNGISDSILTITVNGKGAISYKGKCYSVDAGKLYTLIEEIELATLSDKELLEKIFTDNYWDKVDITNNKGQISVSKILSLPDQFPALTELMSRNTVLQSVSTYGAEILKEYANSADASLRERAAKIGEVLGNLIPNLKTKLENIIKN